MSASSTARTAETTTPWRTAVPYALAFILLLFSPFPPGWAVPVFAVAVLLTSATVYLRYRALEPGDRSARYRSYAGNCILFFTLFLLADLQTFGSRTVWLGGVVFLLLLAAYFGWRSRPAADEYPMAELQNRNRP